jgi:deazaflavin-dependent oxidoreductase (nitroreductase family)
MTAVQGRDATVQTAYSGEASGQAASGQAASHQAAPAQANAIRLGPRARRLIRSVARIVNPLVLRIAGRRYMPVLGIVHHTGRRTGRRYATPLGVRPAVGGGFVMPLTFGEAAGWYRNIRAAGWCVITYRGEDHTVASPVIASSAAAQPAFPRYERLALRLIGVRQFVWLR